MFWKTLSGKTRMGLLLCLFASLGVFLLLCVAKPKSQPLPVPRIAIQPASYGSEPIQPLAHPANLDAGKVRLGRELFHDTRLSVNDSVSCASCHGLQTGGVDRKRVSVGIFHRQGERNAPTVFNSGLNYRQFWDARAPTLEDQINGPLQAETEMGSTWEVVISKLRDDAHYSAEFARLYPEHITPETVRNAIAAFERSLVTPDSRFDRYLKGETKLLTAKELAGYQLFKSLGCVSCHQGRSIGGGMRQPFGVMESASIWGEKTKEIRDERSNLGTLYKVPSLRNVALTAPYFHDGRVNTLPEAVRTMGDVQLCRALSNEEVEQIVAFLLSLTGTYEGKSL